MHAHVVVGGVVLHLEVRLISSTDTDNPHGTPKYKLYLNLL